MAHRDGTWLPLGLACMALGLAAIVIAMAYPYGTVTAMGPGFVPTAVALLLMLFGALILLRRGADAPATEAEGPTPVFAAEGPWRAITCIAAAIVLFGLAIKPLGLPLTAFATILVAGHADPRARLVPLLALAAALAVAASLVFVGLLGLSIPLMPRLGP